MYLFWWLSSFWSNTFSSFFSNKFKYVFKVTPYSFFLQYSALLQSSCFSFPFWMPPCSPYYSALVTFVSSLVFFLFQLLTAPSCLSHFSLSTLLSAFDTAISSCSYFPPCFLSISAQLVFSHHLTIMLSAEFLPERRPCIRNRCKTPHAKTNANKWH